MAQHNVGIGDPERYALSENKSSCGDLLPGAKQSANEDELAEVVCVMVCRQQGLAQNGLPVAMRNLGEQVRRIIR